jgi:hypothetical protein
MTKQYWQVLLADTKPCSTNDMCGLVLMLLDGLAPITCPTVSDLIFSFAYDCGQQQPFQFLILDLSAALGAAEK